MRHGSSTGCWNTTPTSRRGPDTVFPLIVISPSVAPIKPGNHHEQRALAATAGAEQAEEFAVGDVEGDVADRFEIVIELAHGLDAQHR